MISVSDLAILTRLGLVKPVAATLDRSVTEYRVTGAGSILAGMANAAPRLRQDEPGTPIAECPSERLTETLQSWLERWKTARGPIRENPRPPVRLTRAK
jgi:hypothetical protein